MAVQPLTYAYLSGRYTLTNLPQFAVAALGIRRESTPQP